MKKTFKSLLVLSALFFFSPQAAMAEGYSEKAGEKLTNGVANAATGFLEIPKTGDSRQSKSGSRLWYDTRAHQGVLELGFSYRIGYF